MAGLPRHLPGSILLPAVGAAVAGAFLEEWQASPPGRWLASGPRPTGFALQPRDFRPADADAGRRILAGALVLAGAALPMGARGDPWDRPSPTRAFAVELHRFAWLKDLV